MQAVYTAATGLNVSQERVRSIANDMANIGTNGFKSHMVASQDLGYVNKPYVAGVSSEDQPWHGAIQIGLGSKVSAVIRNNIQGTLSENANDLSIAIQGDGYFTLTDENGNVYYTRDGSFSRNSQGKIVNSDGLTVSPGIVVPNDAVKVKITEDGRVYYVDVTGQIQDLGRIEIARFQNSQGLEEKGKNLLVATDFSGEAIFGTPGLEGNGVLKQGYLESSNCNPAVAMVRLVESNRAYELSAKIMKIASEMEKKFVDSNA